MSIDVNKIVSRVSYNGTLIPLDLSGLRTEIVEGEWVHTSADGKTITVYTLKADGTGVYNIYVDKEHEGYSHPVTYTHTDARLWFHYEDGSTRELIYRFTDDLRCRMITEDQKYVLWKRTEPIKVGKKIVDDNMKTFYAKDDGLDGYTEFTVKIDMSGTATDLDCIQYEDTMISVYTGRPVPTKDEYDEILIRGYALIDEIFGGDD